MSAFGEASRLGPTVYIEETVGLAGVTVQISGASHQVHKIYSRRIKACLNALTSVSTEWLEENKSIVVLGAPIADRFREIERQRDELLSVLTEIKKEGLSWDDRYDAAIAKARGES